jgi:hypothetical protein
MTDWATIEAEVCAGYPGHPDTARQMWRWSAGFRDWIDRRGTDVRAVERGDILAFLDNEPWGPGTKNAQQRITAINAVVRAARAFAPARARNPSTASAWVDRVPDRSPLGKAIARVLAGAKTEGDRRRWTTAIGTFGRWSDARGVPVPEAWPGDIDAFRRDYLESGRTSPGEYIRVARRLLAEIGAD